MDQILRPQVSGRQPNNSQVMTPPKATWGTYSQVNPWDWSHDGKHVLVRKANELWHLSWPERVAKPLLQAKGTVRNAQFSPDGRWMVYASNETGNMTVYVSSFPSGNGKWQVSRAGGQEPRWRQDGKELFYLSADGKMMAVAVTAGASFEAGSPVAVTRRTGQTRVIKGGRRRSPNLHKAAAGGPRAALDQILGNRAARFRGRGPGEVDLCARQWGGC